MEETSLKMIDEKIKEFGPQLIGFTTISTQYPFISRVASHVKTHWPSIFLLVGGAYISLAPHNVLSDEFDALCIGEGEYPTAELVAQLEAGEYPHKIQNLWIKKKDKSIEKNPTRPYIQNIDSLPFPDRRMWKDLIENGEGSKQVVLAARGCPFKCTYCSNHALKKVASSEYVRFRSEEDILKEILFLSEQYPENRRIYFQAETLNINKKWVIELCNQLELFNETLDKPFQYSCNFFVIRKFLDEEIFMAFRRANFVSISIGLESGSERIRKEVLKRNYSNEDFLKAASLTRSYGMKLYVYNIIGIPGETLQDYNETVRINNLVNPDISFTNIFIPYPGTDLYEVCKAQGLVKCPFGVSYERQKAPVDMPGFSKKEIERAYHWFEYRVYKGHKSFRFRLKSVLERKVESNHITNCLYSRLRQGYSKVRSNVAFRNKQININHS